jgi:hypothetical protein
MIGQHRILAPPLSSLALGKAATRASPDSEAARRRCGDFISVARKIGAPMKTADADHLRSKILAIDENFSTLFSFRDWLQHSIQP